MQGAPVAHENISKTLDPRRERGLLSFSPMKTLAQLRLQTVGDEKSQTDVIAMALHVLAKRGLEYDVHAMGTDVEGELTAVLSAVAEIAKTLHKNGVTRLDTTLELETRTDKERSLDDDLGPLEDSPAAASPAE